MPSSSSRAGWADRRLGSPSPSRENLTFSVSTRQFKHRAKSLWDTDGQVPPTHDTPSGTRTPHGPWDNLSVTTAPPPRINTSFGMDARRKRFQPTPVKKAKPLATTVRGVKENVPGKRIPQLSPRSGLHDPIKGVYFT
jgi:hypothetical protein